MARPRTPHLQREEVGLQTEAAHAFIPFQGQPVFWGRVWRRVRRRVWRQEREKRKESQ